MKLLSTIWIMEFCGICPFSSVACKLLIFWEWSLLQTSSCETLLAGLNRIYSLTNKGIDVKDSVECGKCDKETLSLREFHITNARHFLFIASVQTQRASELRLFFHMILTRLSCRSWLYISHHKEEKQTRKKYIRDYNNKHEYTEWTYYTEILQTRVESVQTHCKIRKT